MDAFDADVLIYTALEDPIAAGVTALFEAGSQAGIGSVLLLPEVLSKPMRERATQEVAALHSLLARLDLRPLDAPTAALATTFGVTYRLRAADAVHLATAVAHGADRFITNNRADFPRTIAEIDVVYPSDLAG